jgi:hypothetical protein
MDKDTKNRLTVAIFLAGFLMLMAFNGKTSESVYIELISKGKYRPASLIVPVVEEEIKEGNFIGFSLICESSQEEF